MVFRWEGFKVPGKFSPAFFLSRRAMRELSTVVMHDQFFGTWPDFKRGILKETRRKLV